MNSLYELNNYGTTNIDYVDARPPNIVFDRIDTINQTVALVQHDTHVVPLGIEILDIIRPTDCIATYKIDVSTVADATVSWPSTPSGVTLSNPTAGVYIMSGFTLAQWAIVKQPTINLPIGYTGTFTYNPEIKWNSTQTKTWAVAVTVEPVIELTDPTDFYYNASQTALITGNPTLRDNIVDTWTITVLASISGVISSLGSNGTLGGTSTWGGGVLTITGTKAQVNSHLNSITFVSASTGVDDFELIYNALSTTYAIADQARQQWYTLKYISKTRNDSTYVTFTDSTVTGGPLITDTAYTGTGTYTMTVTPSPLESISTLGNLGYLDYHEAQIITNPAPDTGDYWPTESDCSTTGEYVIVGAVLDRNTTSLTGNGTGTVRIFRRVDGVYGQLIYYENPTPTDIGVFGDNPQIDGLGETISFVHFKYSDHTNNIKTYTRSGNTWTAISDIVITDPWPSSNPAVTLKLSQDGKTLFVGFVNGGTYSINGRIYVYVRTTGNWSLQATLAPSEGTSAEEYFGENILTSPDGNTLVVPTHNAFGSGDITPRYAKTITPGSGVSISTSIKKYGTGSFQFSGTGGISITNPSGYDDWNVDLDANGKSNTLESWSYRTRTGQNESLFDSTHFKVDYTSSNTLKVTFLATAVGGGAGTAYTVINYSTSTINTWQHIAVQWSSGNMYLFINGAMVATNNSGTVGTLFTSGQPSSTATLGSTFVGYIDDLRFTFNNAASTGIYSTSGFTAPTGELTNLRPFRGQNITAGSETKLLLHANSFVDDITPTPSTESNVENVGRVYTWSRSGTTWTQRITLAPATNTANQAFGLGAKLYSSGTKLIVPVSGSTTSFIYTKVSQVWTYTSTVDYKPTHISESGDVYITGSSSGGSWSYKIYYKEYGAWFSKDLATAITGYSATGESLKVLSNDGSTYIVAKNAPDPTGAIGIGESFANYGFTYNTGTKVLTLTGTKDRVNLIVDKIILKSAENYTNPITLTYQLTTPSSVTATVRTQLVNHAS